VTSIYEACSFQDITGQRITKVVRMLKSIETRVDALVAAFDPEGRGAAGGEQAEESLQQAGNHGRRRVAAKGDAVGDEALLNGPQGEENAMGQDDIDALLRGFD
jgi:chemotaxis protein CheZ